MTRGKLIAMITAFAVMTPMTARAAGNDADLHRTVAENGTVTLSVSVDKKVAQVADPIQLVVEVEAPQGSRVEMPQLREKLGDFEIRNSEKIRDIPSIRDANLRSWVLRTTLDTVKTGDLVIPSLDVHYAVDATITAFKTLRSQPIRIHITSVLEDRADPTKFRDIKDTVDLVVPEQTSHGWMLWITAGVGGAAAVALATVLLARRNRGLSPAEWAMFQITDLDQLRAEDSAEAESIYNELVDIIREYFELEFGVPTLSRTTGEFLAQAANTVRLGDTPRKRLASLIAIADDIKFARFGVEERQIRRAVDDAKAFVRECEQHRAAMERKAV
jgi:hypothetical protein